MATTRRHEEGSHADRVVARYEREGFAVVERAGGAVRLQRGKQFDHLSFGVLLLLAGPFALLYVLYYRDIKRDREVRIDVTTGSAEGDIETPRREQLITQVTRVIAAGLFVGHALVLTGTIPSPW